MYIFFIISLEPYIIKHFIHFIFFIEILNHHIQWNNSIREFKNVENYRICCDSRKDNISTINQCYGKREQNLIYIIMIPE